MVLRLYNGSTKINKMSNIDSIKNVLSTIKYPGFSRDILSFGFVKNIENEGDRAVIDLSITTTDERIPTLLRKEIEAKICEATAIKTCVVNIKVTNPQETSRENADKRFRPELPKSLEKVKYTIAVSSGKGGVGKSTFAVNLACAFEQIFAEHSELPGTGAQKRAKDVQERALSRPGCPDQCGHLPRLKAEVEASENVCRGLA